MQHEMMEIEREISELKASQSATEQQIKSIFQRLNKQDEILEAVNALALSVRDLTHAQTDTTKKVEGLCEDMDMIKAKPARRWDSIVDKAIGCVIGIIIGYVALKLGLG